MANTFDLVNVNSHSLGLVGRDKTTGRRVVSILIPKNTALPCTTSRRFELARDNQRMILAHVVEGDSHQPEDCVPLGELVLRNLPSNLPATTSIHVEFSYSPDGLLKVSARIPAARRTTDIAIHRLQAERIDDLPTWRNRLLTATVAVGAEAGREPNTFSEPTTVNEAHERLNGLYRVVGEVAVGQSLPWSFSIRKRTAARAAASMTRMQGALKEAEREYETAVTHAEKIYAMGKLSQCRHQYREADAAATKLFVELGSKCADRSLVLPGAESEFGEIRQLREWLANAEDGGTR